MEILGALYIRFGPRETADILKKYVETEMNLSVKDLAWSTSDQFFFQVDLDAEPKPAKQSFDLGPLPKPNFAIFTPLATTVEKLDKTVERLIKEGITATPPQQENSQQEESSPDTPEKQKEGLRNDSTLSDLGQISTAVMEALQKETDWITGRDLAYTMNLKNSYQLRNRVQGELSRFFKEGKVQRQKNSRQNVFEYKALEPHEIPEAAPVGRPVDPDSLSRKVFDLLKESGRALTSAEIAEELDEADSRTLSKILSQFYERDQLARHLPEGSKAFVYSYEPKPEPPTLSPNAQTVFDTLKKFDCLTFYTKICEAVDLPEIEVTKAIKELKVAKRISSPREKPMHYQVVS